MSVYRNILMYLPEVTSPTQKQTLKKRLLWTLGVVVLFLFLASVPLFAVSGDQAEFFRSLELLLGAKIGTLLTLGIGPIVTASIILQLLKGSGIINFDTVSEEGKFIYSGTHKLLTFAFVIIESFVFVAFGAVSPDLAIANSFWWVVLQLAIGGFIVVYLDEIIKKWGFGTGVSLFIAAGIGGALFVQLFSPFTGAGSFSITNPSDPPVGAFFQLLLFLQAGMVEELILTVILPIIITLGLFFIIIFFQAINVEIPLSFGRVRGQGIRWPLNFFYSGVIPVILITALAANLQLWARLLQGAAERAGSSGFVAFISQRVLGQFEGETPISGIVSWLSPVSILDNLDRLGDFDLWIRVFTYTLYLVIGATLFSYFWVQTAGLDSRSQAKNIINSGLQIPGFRKDVRIVERVLDRYIFSLTIMGGIGIGLLASFADLLSALIAGTGILLLIMIVYQFYQQLARESMEDFSLLRRLMRK